MKQAPAPGRLAAWTWPPCSSMMLRTMVRPRPRPPCCRRDDESAWRNGSKTCGRNAGSMPGPVSLTLSTARLPSRRASRVMRPPSGVNLLALSSRLVTTCRSRTGSARSSGNEPRRTSRSWPRPSALGRTASAASRRHAGRSTACRFSDSLPVLIRAMSSRSSMRRVSCVRLLSIDSSTGRSSASRRAAA